MNKLRVKFQFLQRRSQTYTSRLITPYILSTSESYVYIKLCPGSPFFSSLSNLLICTYLYTYSHVELVNYTYRFRIALMIDNYCHGIALLQTDRHRHRPTRHMIHRQLDQLCSEFRFKVSRNRNHAGIVCRAIRTILNSRLADTANTRYTGNPRISIDRTADADRETTCDQNELTHHFVMRYSKSGGSIYRATRRSVRSIYQIGSNQCHSHRGVDRVSRFNSQLYAGSIVMLSFSQFYFFFLNNLAKMTVKSIHSRVNHSSI